MSIDRLEARYRGRFAGHPRISRDPEELEALIAELDALDPSAADAARVKATRDGWTNELEQIRAVRAVPFAVAAARLRMWAELWNGRYARTFAGRDRHTCDVALLDETRAHVRALRDDAAALHVRAPHLELHTFVGALDRAVAVLDGEADQIRQARASGSLADRGSRLADLANAQFAAYTAHFAGESRLSRHPPALGRILAALVEIANGMREISPRRDPGFAADNNLRNLEIVEGHLTRYRTELETILATRKAADPADRAAALGRAANVLFAQYRDTFAGRDRSTVDPDTLALLWEKLLCIALEMDGLDQGDGDDANAGNLSLVTDALLVYARELDTLRSARA